MFDGKVEVIAFTPDPEAVIELGARECYQSAMNGATRSVLFDKLKSKGHLSPFEHAYVTFRVSGVSRAFSHELVRNRIASYSQKSQRFTDKDLKYICPDSIEQLPAAKEIFDRAVAFAELSYRQLRALEILKEDARMVLPAATETSLVFTMNFRELRHLFDLRLAPDAWIEYRKVAMQMLIACSSIAPLVFADYEKNLNNFTAIRVSPGRD